MAELVLRCFSCGQALRSIDNGTSPQCLDAVWFHASGNYGSEVFDDQPGELHINICDRCLRAAPERVIFEGVRVVPPLEYTQWTVHPMDR